MLRKFAAALVATALIAGPAFAQTNPTPSPSAPAAQTTPNKPAAPTTAAKPAVKSTKTVKHAAKHTRKHVRKHESRTGKRHAMHHRHVQSAKRHPASAAKSGKQS